MSPAHEALRQRLARELPAQWLITDPLRLLAWGTDVRASQENLS